jgi:hypothetical protein
MSVVDLTAESPPMTAASTSHDRKRERRVSTSTEGRSQKRKRPAGGGVEEIGLAEDATTAEEDVLRAQQIEAIRSQQVADDDDGLQRIGQRQCVICMENFTNITATHCGEFVYRMKQLRTKANLNIRSLLLPRMPDSQPCGWGKDERAKYRKLSDLQKICFSYKSEWTTTAYHTNLFHEEGNVRT